MEAANDNFSVKVRTNGGICVELNGGPIIDSLPRGLDCVTVRYPNGLKLTIGKDGSRLIECKDGTTIYSDNHGTLITQPDGKVIFRPPSADQSNDGLGLKLDNIAQLITKILADGKPPDATALRALTTAITDISTDCQKALSSMQRQASISPEERSRAEQPTEASAKLKGLFRQAEQAQGNEKPESPREPGCWSAIYADPAIRARFDAKTFAALEKVFGNNPEMYMLDAGSSLTCARCIKEFVTGDDGDRRHALAELEKEASKGNRYALDLLRKLSLVDAVRRLDNSKSPEEQKQALKDIAALEVGDRNDERAKKLLDEFPSSGAKGGETEHKQKAALVNELRQEATQEKVSANLDSENAILNFAQANPDKRAEALEQMRKLHEVSDLQCH